MKFFHRLSAVLLMVVLLLSVWPSASAAILFGETITDYNMSIPNEFIQAAGVMTGDEKGDMNWQNTLTRVEAATMIVRLMGAEEAAQALKTKPNLFVDVPDWANGYVNYAYENNIIKGADATHFAPDRVCTAAEFVTMLFRLTDLTEGSDYNWNTAVDDALAAMGDIDNRKGILGYVGHFMLDGGYGEALRTSTFTRTMAASTVYRMLNIVAGPYDMSLADKLADERGMSDTLLYYGGLRRTSYRFIKDTTTWSQYGLTGPVTTTFTLVDGNLVMDDPNNAPLTVSSQDDSVLEQALTNSTPLPLPKQDVCLAVRGGVENEVLFLNVAYRYGRYGFLPQVESGSETYSRYYAATSPKYVESLQVEYQRQLVTQPNLYGKPVPADIQALTLQVIAGKTTEMEKAIAINRWVAEHYYYDIDEMRGGEDTSAKGDEAILSYRRGVCQDYARLTQKMMRTAGLECYLPSSSIIGHEWNLACLDGEWYWIDNTWDSPLRYENGQYCKHNDSRPVENYLEPNVKAEMNNFVPQSNWKFVYDHPPDYCRSIPRLADYIRYGC